MTPKYGHLITARALRSIIFLTLKGIKLMRRDSLKVLIKRLENEGLYFARVKDSHHQFKNLKRAGRVTVPHPKGNIYGDTLRSI